MCRTGNEKMILKIEKEVWTERERMRFPICERTSWSRTTLSWKFDELSPAQRQRQRDTYTWTGELGLWYRYPRERPVITRGSRTSPTLMQPRAHRTRTTEGRRHKQPSTSWKRLARVRNGRHWKYTLGSGWWRSAVKRVWRAGEEEEGKKDHGLLCRRDWCARFHAHREENAPMLCD